MKERWRDREITQRRCAEFVPITHITADLFEAEILIRARAVEDRISQVDTEERCDLRCCNDTLLEVGEHFIGLPDRGATRYGVALHASSLAEEQERTALLRSAHRSVIATRKAIDGRIGKNQGELEFGDGLAEHEEID
jgi:hypothetical protein